MVLKRLTMFGMGFTEILIIMVIAILFLGPDKLPGAMVDIAKFLKSAKDSIGSLKESFEHEMDATGIKAEALAYKKELESAQEKLSKVTDIKGSIDSEISSIKDELLNSTEESPQTKKAPKEDQEVTFAKKSKNIESDKTDKDEIKDV